MEKAERKCNCSLAAASRPRHSQICTSKQFYYCFGPEVFHDNTTLEMKVSNFKNKVYKLLIKNFILKIFNLKIEAVLLY